MGNHVLSLIIPDVLNECILRIEDSSVYSDVVPFLCPQLHVTAPGFSYSTEFDNLPQGFIRNLTTCDLGLQSKNCGVDFGALPDGVYIARWSTSPNDIVYVEYNHLRMTKALLKYRAALCSLKDLKGCAPEPRITEQLDKLYQIKMMLDAAKAQVEFCHNPKKGMEIFKYATEQLRKFECKTC